MNFLERKIARTKNFNENVKGWKVRYCTACMGSGWYDNTINGKQPKCGSCNGTGKEKYKPKSV
jgi:DnaJ-class molecular chaperone